MEQTAEYENAFYKAEVKVDGEWCSNAKTFDTRKEAEEYGSDLYRRWLLTTDYRVIEIEMK